MDDRESSVIAAWVTNNATARRASKFASFSLTDIILVEMDASLITCERCSTEFVPTHTSAAPLSWTSGHDERDCNSF